MTAARNTQKGIKDEDALISYRLGQVEDALKDLTSRFDKLDNIKKSDLMELRDTIIGRIVDNTNNLQKQIDALNKDKASAQDVTDFKKQVYAATAFVGALVVAAFSYMLTRLK